VYFLLYVTAKKSVVFCWQGAVDTRVDLLEEEVEDLVKTKDRLENKIKRLMNEKKELQEKVEELEDGTEKLNEINKALVRTNRQLATTNAELADKNEEFTKMKEDLTNTKEELTKTKGELAIKTAQHASVVDSHSKKASKFTAATAENERLRNKVERLEKQNADLQAKLDKGAAAASLAEIESLKAQVKARDEKLESTAKALGEQKDRSRDCKKQFDKAMEENGKSFSEKLAFEVFFSFRGSFRTLTLFSSGQADRRV